MDRHGQMPRERRRDSGVGVLPCPFMADVLLRDELDERILSIADELAEDFAASIDEAERADLRLALSGLQLTFLSRVAKLVTGE